MKFIYGEFRQDIVLTRLFATLPFAKLPPLDQSIANRLLKE